MGNPFSYLWRHPRRAGFIVFNLIVLALFVSWGFGTSAAVDDGMGGIPTIMLGITGMSLLIIVWVVGWIAWGTMAATHHRHRT